MDTSEDHRQPANRTGDQKRGGGRRGFLGPGSIALAGAAIVAVVASSVWALAAGDERSVVPTGSPASTATASITPTAGGEAIGTLYLWDPNTGEGRIVGRAQAIPTDAELAPGGRRVVYAIEGLDGVSQIYLQIPGEAPRPLTDLSEGAFEPTWSPDGSQIAFAGSMREGEDTDIFVMNADGSDVRRWFGTRRDDGHPDWSPDGSQIAFNARYDNGAPGGEIWVASVRTGRLTRLTSRWIDADPAWSPDGRTIAYSRGWGGWINGTWGGLSGSEIWVMDPNGSHNSRVGDPAGRGDLAGDPSWSPDGRFIAFEHGDDGIGMTYPRAGGSQPFSTPAADPSWAEAGILMTLLGDPPDYSPGTSPGLRVDPDVDATIVMTDSTCALESAPLLLPRGKVTIEFVNASRLDGRFTMIRMAPGQTVADIEADPAFVWTQMWHERLIRDVVASWTDTWSAQVVAGDRWAVACWKYPRASDQPFTPGGTVGLNVASVRGS